MKPAKASLLLHPVFLISLFLLLLNDLYWKHEYSNWATGKLSDVAGLIVFPVFLNELVKKVSKTVLIIFSALFFVWWKSPFSQPVINLFSSLNIQLHRTIDYTDLFALVVLPFFYFLKPVSYTKFPSLQKKLKPVIGLLTFFALCADTPYRMLPYSKYVATEIQFTEEFCWADNGEDYIQYLRDKGLSINEETERYYPLYHSYQALYYRVQNSDSSISWKPISFTPDSLVYVKHRLYERNYVISEYKIEDETFQNIRFRMRQSNNGSKICVQMISFDSGNYETHPDKKTRKQLRKYFENLFGIQKQ